MIPERPYARIVVLEPDDAEERLDRLLNKDGENDLPHGDHVARLDFLRLVDPVALKYGPLQRVEEVEEEGEDPVREEGGEDGGVLVRHAGDDFGARKVVDRVLEEGSGGTAGEGVGGGVHRGEWERQERRQGRRSTGL